VGLRDPPDDRQAEPDPVPRRARRAVERLEQPRRALAREAGAAVGHRDADAVRAPGDRDQDGGPRPRELDGVRDQVDQHLADPPPVRTRLNGPAAGGHVQPEALLLQQRLHDRPHLERERDDVERGRPEVEAALADRRGAEQVLDQGLGPECPAADREGHPPDLGPVEMVDVLGEELRRGRQAGQRGAQVVGDHRQQIRRVRDRRIPPVHYCPPLVAQPRGPAVISPVLRNGAISECCHLRVPPTLLVPSGLNRTA
jgi:hypothetical protein